MDIYFKSSKDLYWYFIDLNPISYKYQNKVISRTEEIIKEYLENAESIDEIIKFRKKMNDEEFIKKLENIVRFDICCYDIETALRRKGIEYDDMYINVPTTTRYDLTILADQNFEWKHLHNYSLDEIKKLVDNEDIVVIEEYKASSFRLVFGSKYITEKCETFNPILKRKERFEVRESLDDYFTKKDDFYYKTFINYIRSQVKTSWLKEELEKYIHGISLGLNTMNEQVNNENEPIERRDVIKSCLDNMNEKGYVKRLEKLKENYY